MGHHINDIAIILTDDRHKYQSGDYINGKVVISVADLGIKVSVLLIRLSCVARVEWVELSSFKSDGHSVNIKKKYWKENFPLPDKDQFLNPGINEIPFVFKIPERGLPSTFEGPHGSIEYVIQTFVEEPDNEEGVRTQCKINVEAPFRDYLFLSVGGSAEKELSLYNLGYGKIVMNANILKKAYYPGETAEVICRIMNDSTADVKPRASLHCTQIYMSGERHKTVESSITEYALGEKVMYERDAISLIQLQIPDDIPLSLKCPNITVKYFIHVTLVIPHTIDLHLNLPIIVTTESAFNYTSDD